MNIPAYIENKIADHSKQIDDESNNSLQEKVKYLVDELSKNPPVPWVQYNDWPACCNDFGRYIGEWDQSDIMKNAQDKNTKEYIMSVLDEFSRKKIEEYDSFWDDIGNGTVIFAFECIHCSKITAVCQSY